MFKMLQGKAQHLPRKVIFKTNISKRRKNDIRLKHNKPYLTILFEANGNENVNHKIENGQIKNISY